MPVERPRCPRCGSADQVVQVVVGYPPPGAHRVGVKEWGCILDAQTPAWWCEACRAGFGRHPLLDREDR